MTLREKITAIVKLVQDLEFDNRGSVMFHKIPANEIPDGFILEQAKVINTWTYRHKDNSSITIFSDEEPVNTIEIEGKRYSIDQIKKALSSL